MAATTIEWTDYTFNPWRGCSKISPGCEHCYAETMSKRNPATLGVWGPHNPRVLAAESYWELPYHWNHRAAKAGVRKKVFCASLADWLEDSPHQLVNTRGESLSWQATDERMRPWTPDTGRGFFPDSKWWTPYTLDHARARLLLTIHATPHLDWLLLTKRPEHFSAAMQAIEDLHDQPGALAAQWRHGNPLANIWLGVSVEDQPRADERIPRLLDIRARIRFLSCEPLLGPLDLTERFVGGSTRSYLTGQFHNLKCTGVNGNPDFIVQTHESTLPRVHWLIAGGESGPHARPMHPAWPRSLRDQCHAAAVPFFFKQWGEWTAEGQGDTAPEGTRADATIVKNGSDYCAMFKCGKKHAGRLLDGQLHNAFPQP